MNRDTVRPSSTICMTSMNSIWDGWKAYRNESTTVSQLACTRTSVQPVLCVYILYCTYLFSTVHCHSVHLEWTQTSFRGLVLYICVLTEMMSMTLKWFVTVPSVFVTIPNLFATIPNLFATILNGCATISNSFVPIPKVVQFEVIRTADPA